MRVLILSQYGDVHAEAVDWALKQRGIRTTCWTISDFPSRQRITVTLSDRDGPRFDVRQTTHEHQITQEDLRDVTVVWNRRLGRPTLHNYLDPQYAPYARDECQRFIRSLSFVLAPAAKWVNSPHAARLYESKLPQLVQASRAGLAIPETIVTNDPAKVAAFCQRHGEIIYKAFLVPSWSFQSGAGRALAVTFTTRLTRQMLDEHLDGIEFAPGIFQPLVPKRCELRVVVMGDQVLAARLDSQSSPETSIDWRASQTKFGLEKISLPASLMQRIRRFMKACGLKFGCLDLIETPSGEHVFLEVNQMGQFLWLDDANDELDTFQEFCSFLANTAGAVTHASEFPDYREYRASDCFRNFSATLDEALVHFQNQQTHVLA